ncbi:MAG TPA: hypothetical protein VF719_08860 [Abditibacteriaceae bacterium]|jgi:hypothetical protein
MAKSATATRPQLDSEQIETIIAGLEEKDQAKLLRFIPMEIERMGYAVEAVRNGSATWEKARDTVIRNIYGNDQTLADIEEREE